MAHDKKRKQALERYGWNHAKIDCRNGVCMFAQECSPSLRWRPSVPDHVFGDRRLGDLESALQQFAMDALGAPKWVSLLIRRMRSRSSLLTGASLAERVISSANRPETLLDATAGSCQAERHGTNRAGLARAKSSIPKSPGHSHAAADDAAHAAGQY